jgi:hypothetical protein
MAFNFNLDVKPTNTTKYLKPYDIYNDVTIDAVEIKDGTSQNGNAWKSIVITFKNDQGIYNDSIFWLKDPKDTERGTYDMPNGGKRETPSAWERARDKMAAIGFTFFPENFAKLQEATSKKSFKNIAEAFDFIGNNFVACARKAIGGVKTGMKLIGRNSNGTVYATLPSCTGMAQANAKTAASNNVEVGEWYTWLVNPFGDNLSFSTYEMQAREKFLNAKPTEPDNLEIDTASSDDLDFESLL